MWSCLQFVLFQEGSRIPVDSIENRKTIEKLSSRSYSSGFEGNGESISLNVQRCTQKNHLEIWLTQPEIRLYLPFSDWFGTNRCMVNTILFRFDLIRFRKDFSVCSLIEPRLFFCSNSIGALYAANLFQLRLINILQLLWVSEMNEVCGHIWVASTTFKQLI